MHDNGEPGVYIGDSPHANAALSGNNAFRNGVGGGEGFGFLFRDSSHGDVHGNRAAGNCIGFIFVDTSENPDPVSEDIVWDKSGSGNSFRGNDCKTSQPSWICSWRCR